MTEREPNRKRNNAISKAVEDLVGKPVQEMSFGETIPHFGPIPRKKEDRMITLVGLMRSEVHLPNPGSIYKDFTPEQQEQIVDSLRGMTSKQLSARIKEEVERLRDETRQQWPRNSLVRP